MTLPHADQRVNLVVPQREQVPAHVVDAGPGWLDVELERALRQRPPGGVFVHYVCADGVMRLAGRISDVHDLGLGARVRVLHRRTSQLLKRSELVSAAANLKVVAIRVGPDPVAATGRAVHVSGQVLRLRGFPSIGRGQLHDVELALEPGEPPVQGEVRVERMLEGNDAEVRFTSISPRDKARLIAWCVERAAGRTAA